jgi:hypothetical protein
MEPQAKQTSFNNMKIIGVIPIFENNSYSSFNSMSIIGVIPIFENNSYSVIPSEGIRELI